jgi:hypothetical protein
MLSQILILEELLKRLDLDERDESFRTTPGHRLTSMPAFFIVYHRLNSSMKTEFLPLPTD